MKTKIVNMSDYPVALCTDESVPYGYVQPHETTYLELPGSGDGDFVFYDTTLTAVLTVPITYGTAVEIAVLPDGTGYNYVVQYTGIATTYDIPVIGEVTTPDWALVSPEMTVFFLGFATAVGIRLFRACLRWFRKASDPGDNQ